MEVTESWFTEALLRGGGLLEGRIRSFDVESSNSNHGRNSRLTLVYESGSTGEAIAGRTC